MKPIRLIVAGCRNFKNAELIFKTLLTIFEKVDYNNIEIVSGGCVGVDTIAIEFAKAYDISYKIFEANWKEFGKAAGPIRNGQMAKYGTHLLAFWDLKSKGTKNMILNAKQNNLHIKVVQDEKYIKLKLFLNF